MLESDPAVRVDGIDLAPTVVEDARRRLLGTDVGSRAALAVGDARTWRPPTGTRYGLVTLINNLYYFTAEERVALFGRLASMTEPDGGLVAVSMVTPGSVASAHLHFMLVSQAAPAALPRAGQVEAELTISGWRVRRAERIVPTEPFVAIHADRE
jgi:hypothetical protein